MIEKIAWTNEAWNGFKSRAPWMIWGMHDRLCDRLAEGRDHSFQVLFGKLIVAVLGHDDGRISRVLF